MKRVFAAVALSVLFLAGCVSQEAEREAASAEAQSAPDGEGASAAEQMPELEIPELDIEEFIRGRIVEAALACLGAPYRAAGTTPEGFDCSGLVCYAYQEGAGIAMPRSTTGLWAGGKALEKSKLKKGDIVVFSTVRAGASHAGIVVENSADGIRFVHAASSGAKTGVIVSSLNEAYYKTRYMGGRGYL